MMHQLLRYEHAGQRHMMNLKHLIQARHSHVHYMYMQQNKLVLREQMVHDTYNMRQTLYLICKRPREVRGPILWEIPHQPLPKYHKAY